MADTVESDPHEYEVGEIVTLTGEQHFGPVTGRRYRTTDGLWVAAEDVVPHE